MCQDFRALHLGQGGPLFTLSRCWWKNTVLPYRSALRHIHNVIIFTVPLPLAWSAVPKSMLRSVVYATPVLRIDHKHLQQRFHFWMLMAVLSSPFSFRRQALHTTSWTLITQNVLVYTTVILAWDRWLVHQASAKYFWLTQSCTIWFCKPWMSGWNLWCASATIFITSCFCARPAYGTDSLALFSTATRKSMLGMFWSFPLLKFWTFNYELWIHFIPPCLTFKWKCFFLMLFLWGEMFLHFDFVFKLK